MACRELRLELNLNTSLVEADNALVRTKLTPATCDCALARALFALVRALFALVNAEFTLVTAKLARFRLNEADEVALLAFRETMEIDDDAEFSADLIPLEADIEACCSCCEKVAFSLIIVLEISTVARSTEAAIRLEQSWGLFCRSSIRVAVEAVMRASWADLDPVDCSRGCGCDIGEDSLWMCDYKIFIQCPRFPETLLSQSAMRSTLEMQGGRNNRVVIFLFVKGTQKPHPLPEGEAPGQNIDKYPPLPRPDEHEGSLGKYGTEKQSVTVR